MRIIGGKDFYDKAAAFGQDTDIVFLRHKEKYIDQNVIKLGYFYDSLSHLGFINEPRTSFIALIPYFIIVAGKLWPMVCIENRLEYKYSKIYCYSYIELMQNLSSILKYEESKYRYRSIYDTKNFFDKKLTNEQMDWLRENKITIMHNEYRLDFEPNKYDRKRYRWKVDSFDLHTFQFQRVVDPYSLHQEISMWVGNMGKPGNLMVEIKDDKIKVAKHGFDKYSFRKAKESSS